MGASADAGLDAETAAGLSAAVGVTLMWWAVIPGK